MNIYSYPKCSSCKNALSYLSKNDVKVQVTDISTNPPSIKELGAMLEFQDGNLKKLFNTSGKLYRELNIKEKLPDMDTKDALKLLSQNGMLVKRPFLLSKDVGLVGFKENEWQKLLA